MVKMNITINDDATITVDGRAVSKVRFNEYVNRLGHREWHVGSASGIMSWTEYYESDLFQPDLIAFLSKYISSRNTKQTHADNPR